MTRWIFIFLLLGTTAVAQNAYGPDFLNLHCTAPDPLAQVLFNIQPRPGLVPDHAANGNAILYCDAGSGLMKASYNGSAYSFLGAPAVALDVRSSASVFDCTGTTAMDTAMQSIASTAHIVVPFGCVVKLASAHTYAQTFEFKQGAALAPTTGTLITLTGPIIAGSYQIFNNAQVGQGGIDFTGNTNQFDIYPEWWGAVAGGSAATNTPAMQAAFYGSFGCNTSPATSCRSNSSGFQIYNKRLALLGIYKINAQIKFYHVLGFTIDCSRSGRLVGGIQQTGGNNKILDGQSDAYGAFINCAWSTTASQDLSHPLIDLNFDGSQGADLAPQFIDFYSNTFSGGGSGKIGVRIAAAGGSAQGSNINFYNSAAASFTEAAYMVGAGSSCTPTAVAANAISINWYGGDIQGSNAFGIENFGGTNLSYNDATMENGGFISIGLPAQTGADFCSNDMNAGGGAFKISNYRSESAKVLTDGGIGGSHWDLRNVRSVDNAQVAVPGITPTVGDYVQGNTPCNHGLWNNITAVSAAFSGLGSRSSPLSAASGTATSITDSVGGFTVNAWNGWQVCILSGTAANEYCLITSNSASTFTCSAGFKTDYTVTVVAPDNTSRYTIEPNWGTQTVSGGVTWAIDNSAYPGIDYADTVFFPGRRVFGSPGSIFNNVQLTRPDWAGTSSVGGIGLSGIENVIVGGTATAGAGIALLNLSSNTPLIRPYSFTRNSITEIPMTLRQELGTRSVHWWSAQAGGGTDASDVYIGTDSNLPSTGQGDWFIINNSSNTAKKWSFNFDGSTSAPAPITSTGSAAALTGTGACATTSTQAGGNFAGNITCTGATAASTLVITPGTTAPHGIACFANDITHTLAGTQSAVSATACTMSFTSVTANDVLTFGVLAY